MTGIETSKALAGNNNYQIEAFIDKDSKKIGTYVNTIPIIGVDHLNKIIKNHRTSRLRVGLGMVYHNSPSNVPVNFAFSLVFGLLSGNTNVVRLSSKGSDSELIILNVISELLATNKYSEIRQFI